MVKKHWRAVLFNEFIKKKKKKSFLSDGKVFPTFFETRK